MIKKLLIADDDPEIRLLIKKTLDLSDYEIYESKNGIEALGTVFYKKPDVILLDIMMPGPIDGLEVCRLIKSSQWSSHIRVVLLSALSGVENLKAAGLVDADAYLVKPFQIMSLLETLKTESRCVNP